jgi:hypothetical protein
VRIGGSDENREQLARTAGRTAVDCHAMSELSDQRRVAGPRDRHAKVDLARRVSVDVRDGHDDGESTPIPVEQVSGRGLVPPAQLPDRPRVEGGPRGTVVVEPNGPATETAGGRCRAPADATIETLTSARAIAADMLRSSSVLLESWPAAATGPATE